MSTTKTQFQAFLKEEIDKVNGIYYPVRMPFLLRILTRVARTRTLHPNPDDEFCIPSIGPNYEIISRYERDYQPSEKCCTKQRWVSKRIGPDQNTTA